MSRGRRRKPKQDPQSYVISFRVDPESYAKLELYTKELKEESPGASWSVHTAAKNGLVMFLNEWDGEQDGE